ncbi:hypothetical protein DFH06DRAFT_1204392 [Mycena polygramma]|nr:hypothetical protein DFH06DRAFT_1204392 [Mycena polygramma]
MLRALEEDRARLADIQAQIVTLERSIVALRAEETLVQQRLNSYTYPVLSLPNEIASEIFVHFLPPYPICPPITGAESPTSLTLVCRTWREIALATPDLWRAIQLSDKHLPFYRQYHICDSWLSRSGSRPLSLCIKETNNGIGRHFLLAIVAQRTRWENLELHLTVPLEIPITGGPMPQLRRLELRLDFPKNLVFDDVPLLRTVLIDDYAAANITVPWVQLTSLTLHHVCPSECLPVLRQTPNLIHCELLLWWEDGPVPDITLPHLESLTVREGSEPITHYLETLAVPALLSLQIVEEFLWPSPIGALSSFILKSGCKLHELHIIGPRDVSEESYRKAFPLIPTLSFTGLHRVDPANADDSD